jgi:methyl-accepting chemotaxis protein
MSHGTEEVEKGKALADKAGEFSNEIILGAGKAVDAITRVADAGEKQAAISEEISKNLEIINNVTQESTAGISQIAKSSKKIEQIDNKFAGIDIKIKINNEVKKITKDVKIKFSNSGYTVRSNRALIK